MSRESIQAKADAKRGYTKDYAASAAKIEARGGPVSPYKSSREAISGSNTSGYKDLKDLSIQNSPGGVAPVAPAPINRAVKTPKTPDFYGDAYKQVESEAQARINAINSYATEKMQSLLPRQEERLAETGSINALTGMAGSTEAKRTTEQTSDINKKENDLVRAEAEMQVAAIMDGLSTKALEQAKFARESFTAEAERTAEERVARQTEDLSQATTLAMSGVTAEGLKASDPASYQYLAEALGGEEMLKATFTLNRPVEQILDKKIEGGKYIISYQNPIDGKVRIETVDLGLPVGYSKTIDAGNRILAIPDNWDGDPAGLVTINKGLTPGQSLSGSGSGLGVTTSQKFTSEKEALDSVSPLARELLKNPKGFFNLTKTEQGKILRELANAGIDTGSLQEGKKRNLSATQSDDLVQAQIARDGVLALKEKLDELQNTGPVIGRLREMNPYDPQVVAIMAEINRIVPGLARGIFKEVGVLTDTDIRRYTETLANPRATKEQIEQLHKDTMKKIDNSLNTISSTYEDLGYDLYNFNVDSVTSSQSASSGGVLRSPDGTQEVNISDLTKEQIQEAKNAGWL